MAEYQTDDNVALKHLKLAEESLSHRAIISTSDRDEEMSRILRNRAVRAARSGNQPLAEQALQQLEALANGSRNRVIQSSYHGAAGALLMDQKKYEEAIAQLEEDQDNPFTLELLVQAYYQDRAARQAARSGSQAPWNQCTDHGASAGGPRGPSQAADHLAGGQMRADQLSQSLSREASRPVPIWVQR